MEVLNISPLTKFTITDQMITTKMLPGTEGFIAFVTSQGSYISTAHTIITKKGKKGKPRIEKTEISVPIIWDPTVPTQDFFGYCSHMDLESSKTNVMDMDDLDFLGWASAYRYLLGHLSQNSTINYTIWTKSDDSAVRELYRQLGSRLEYKLELVSDKGFRQRFIDEIRSAASILNENLANYYQYNSIKMIQDAFVGMRRSYNDCLPGGAEQHKAVKEFEKSWMEQFKEK